MMERRGFLKAALFVAAAPAIVRASSLMAVRAIAGDGIALRTIPHPGWQADAHLDEAIRQTRAFTSRFNLGLIREQLLPGVRKMIVSPDVILPRHWEDVFA